MLTEEGFNAVNAHYLKLKNYSHNLTSWLINPKHWRDLQLKLNYFFVKQ